MNQATVHSMIMVVQLASTSTHAATTAMILVIRAVMVLHTKVVVVKVITVPPVDRIQRQVEAETHTILIVSVVRNKATVKRNATQEQDR